MPKLSNHTVWFILPIRFKKSSQTGIANEVSLFTEIFDNKSETKFADVENIVEQPVMTGHSTYPPPKGYYKYFKATTTG
jgi:hypothetical protein